MSEYFKPLSRRVGVVALMIACLLMMGWLRSYRQFDDIEVGFGITSYGASSMGGGIDFYRFTFGDVADTFEWPSLDIASNALSVNRNDTVDPWGSHQIEWRWDWMGFHIGEANVVGSGQRARHDQDCMVPYWAMVLPMTVLSALLLLRKRTLSNGA